MSSKKRLVTLVSESYVTDGTLDHYTEHLEQPYLDIEGLIREMDAHEEAARQLESIQNVVHAKIEDGEGISPGAAQMVNLVLESIYSRVNMKPVKPLVPVLEQFNEHSGKIATTIVLEGIADTLTAMAKKVAEIISMIWDRIKAFFKNLFSYKNQLIEETERIRKQIDEIPDDAVASSDKIQSNVATESHVDSTLMRLIPFGIKGHCDAATTRRIVEDTSTLIVANREIVLEIVTCLKRVEAPVDINAIHSEIDNLVQEVKHRLSRLELNSKKVQGNRVVYSYGHFIHGQSCEVREYVGLEDSSDIPRLFNLEVHLALPDQDVPYVPEVLAKNEMSKLAMLSIKLVEKSQDLDKVIPIVEKVLKANLDFLKSKFNPTPDQPGKEMSLAIHAVRDLFRYINVNLPKISGDANRAANGVQAYIKKCLPYYRAA